MTVASLCRSTKAARAVTNLKNRSDETHCDRTSRVEEPPGHFGSMKPIARSMSLALGERDAKFAQALVKGPPRTPHPTNTGSVEGSGASSLIFTRTGAKL